MAKSRKGAKNEPKNDFEMFEGSGNVFQDLGFSKYEAVNLLARSRLMIQIKNIIEERRLTQADAAKLLGVRQPRVSSLFTGRIEEFTVDMLMKWLDRLGKEVVLIVKDKEVA